MNEQPESGLSDAARDVRHELERLAQEYRETEKRDATGPELVLMLARKWCPARLKRSEQ